MTARSPSAFFLSASLHGLVVAVIVLLSYLAQVQMKEPPKILVLVAGPGDDYGSTAAPALGVPGGVKVTMPDLPAPTPVKPTPPAPVSAPTPEPVTTKAPVQKAVTKAPPKPESAIPDLAKSVKRIEAKRRAKIEAKDRAAREAEQKRISKAEFDRENKAARAAGSGNPNVKHIDTEGVNGGVYGGSTASKTGAGGKALTREEGDLLDAYFALVKQRLQENLEKPPGLSDSITAEAEFQLNADGSISGARITRSSGSDEFDRAVLDDIRHFKRISPPKSWSGDTVDLTFRMKEEDSG